MLRHVRHQPDVAVRQRRDDEFLFQPREASDRIRPRLQSMPRAVERVFFRLAQRCEAELDEDLVERHPVQRVELRPRQLARPHAVHARSVARAPRVGEFRAVDRDVLPLRELLHLGGHGAPPVDDGAEDVEDERLDSRELRIHR